MDIKSELNETIAESRLAKATKERWISEARDKAGNHGMFMFLWIIIIIVSVLATGGLYIDIFSFATKYLFGLFDSLYSGLTAYNLYIGILLIVIGAVRVIHHKKEKDAQINFANQIESMSLKAFRRQYM